MTVKIVVLEEANGPGNLAATSAESGNQFDVMLTWDAPTGGGAVTGYRVEHQPDPALQWRTLESDHSGTTYTDSGLGRGTVRYYRVAALRSGGASYSQIVRVQAPSETQEVPEKVNLVEVKPAAGSDTALEVAWNRPRTPNSRAPATGYHVQYAQHDGAAPACSATGRTGRGHLPEVDGEAALADVVGGGRGNRVRGKHAAFADSEDGGDGSGAGHELPGAGARVHGGGLWGVVLSASVDDIGSDVERDGGAAPDGDAGGLPGQP